MLSTDTIERILTRLPSLHIGVVGDVFLDRYLDLDARLTEPSVETGLDAYQVVRVRCYPGAAGTILNNLVALGVGHVSILSIIGDDGEGYELRRELTRRGIDQQLLIQSVDRFTPTYTKPMLRELAEQPCRSHELNRIDIKNRTPLPGELEQRVLNALPGLFHGVDALLVLDQVSEPECGVITTRVRERLAELGKQSGGKLILADSRSRIGLFRHLAVKPNEAELASAFVDGEGDIKLLARRMQAPVFWTRGKDGILLADPSQSGIAITEVPGYPVSGAIDPVGAGDSTSAGIACAFAGGCSLVEAAAFGNLIASITIQQIGTTGTASPEQVRKRWREVEHANDRYGESDAN
jgi:bifunctional ADP-heptose synthase (sugar kinase/adenylyltransferase)